MGESLRDGVAVVPLHSTSQFSWDLEDCSLTAVKFLDLTLIASILNSLTFLIKQACLINIQSITWGSIH
jgi:hypothetical protein